MYFDAGHYPAAIESIQKVIVIDSRRASLWSILAESYYRLGDRGNAASACAKAQAIDHEKDCKKYLSAI